MDIVFSFDDGRIDAFDSSKILAKYHLVGTFHITTGFIDGSFVTNAFGANRMPLSPTMILDMHRLGMEISSHGDSHILDSNDFLVSSRKLNDYTHENNIYGFSVPNSAYNDSALSEFISNTGDMLKYVRVGRNKKCYSFYNKVRYFLYHKFHFFGCFKRFNEFNLIYSVNCFELFSLVVKNDTKIEHIIKFLKGLKDQDCSLIFMFHSIVDKPQDPWEYSLHDFEKLCSFIEKEKINVLTMDEMVKKNSKL